MGDGIFKTFRTADSSLKLLTSSLGKRESFNYTCHAWLPDDKERCIVACASGELLLVEGGEVKTVLQASDGQSIEAMVAYSKGFVCGSDGGVLTLYEKAEDAKELYKKTNTFRIENHAVRVCVRSCSLFVHAQCIGCKSSQIELGVIINGATHHGVVLMQVKIKNLAISPSEETLICTLETNQMFVLGLSNSDILKPEEMNFELLAQAFHSHSVTGKLTCKLIYP